MIVVKIYERQRGHGILAIRAVFKGVFLFGFIPLYIKQVTEWK